MPLDTLGLRGDAGWRYVTPFDGDRDLEEGGFSPRDVLDSFDAPELGRSSGNNGSLGKENSPGNLFSSGVNSCGVEAGSSCANGAVSIISTSRLFLLLRFRFLYSSRFRACSRLSSHRPIRLPLSPSLICCIKIRVSMFAFSKRSRRRFSRGEAKGTKR